MSRTAAGAPPPAIAVFAGQKVPAFLAPPRRPFGLRWMFFMTLLALVAGLAIVLPAAIVVVLIEDEAVDWQISEQWLNRILFAAGIVLYAVAFLALPRWLLRRRRSQHLMRWRRPRRADFGWALIAVGVSWGTLLLYDLIAGEFGPEILRPEPIIRFDETEIDFGVSNEWLAFYAFAAIIAAPLAEEGFFRGFLLGGLRRARDGVWGRRIALLVSAILFAGAHFYVPLLIPFTIGGLIFGLLYIRTNSLTAPTLAHCGHNVIAFIVTLHLWDLL